MDDPVILRSMLEQEQNLNHYLKQKLAAVTVQCDALRAELKAVRQQCDTEVLHKYS
jgi:hypothetical protein